MSARWTFKIDEVSPGHYRCEAIRQTHHSISRDGSESAIAQLLQDAFEMEVQFGTIPGEAAFLVTSGFQPFWRSEYLPKVFGSWLVESSRQPRRAVYDGKDFHLALYRQSGPPVWQGHISELQKPVSDYFTKLVYL
jgi:hypothetical protein